MFVHLEPKRHQGLSQTVGSGIWWNRKFVNRKFKKTIAEKKLLDSHNNSTAS